MDGERRRHENGRGGTAAVCFAAGILAVLLNGCGSGVQTESEIVTPKEEQTLAGGESMTATGTLTEQLQAPERYQSDFSQGAVSVTADSAILVPDVEGIKTKQVTYRAFTQEDYDRIMNGLLGDGTLWDRDYEAMEASHGFTREELEEKIAETEAQKAEWGGHGDWEYEGMGITIDERIEQLKILRDAAPQEAVIREIPAVVSYQESGGYNEENWLSGYKTVDGTDYRISLDNQIYDAFYCADFSIQRAEDNGKYKEYSRVADTEEAEGLEEESGRVLEEAAALAEKLGLSDFEVWGGENYICYRTEGDTLLPDQAAFGVHLVRTVEGVPVTYSHEYGDGGELFWPEEALDLIYGREGLVTFHWMSPYQIEDLSEDYVFLLPFSEIQSIFEEMIVKRYEDMFRDEGQTIELTVDEVRLGYMRVRNKENLLEATLVPVWDFCGTSTASSGSFKEPYVMEEPFTSLLTINAMDGTVINRGVGY